MSVESSDYRDAAIAAGVSSFWALGSDGASGVDLTDSVGDDDLVVTSGSASAAASSAINGQDKACSLNGATWLNKTGAATAIGGSFSVCAVVKWGVLNSGWAMVISTDEGDDYFTLQRRNNVIAVRAEVAGTTVGVDSTITIVADTWYRVVFTYDAGSGTSKIYVDGEDVTDSATIAASVSGDNLVTIGADGTGGSVPFTGQVQGIGFASVAWSAGVAAGLDAAAAGEARYELLRRDTPSGADTLVAVLPAGTLTHTVEGLADDSVGYYWVRAVSGCNVRDNMPVSGRLRRVALEGDGDLIDPAPNAPYNVRLVQGPSGLVTARWAYRPDGAEAVATKFHVYYATGASAISYASPDFTVSTVAQDNSQALGTFANGTAVKCVVRAVTAGDVEETNTNEATGTADAAAPTVPKLITVTGEAS